MAPRTQGKTNSFNADDAYVPIETASLRVDTSPPFDLFVQHAADQPFILYCERNLPFTKDARNNLRQNSIETLFIPANQQSQYQRYVAEHLPQILDQSGLTLGSRSAILYDAARTVVEEIFNNPASRKNIQKGKEVVRETVDYMMEEKFVFEKFLQKLSTDYYLFTHSVNVVTYSVALAMRAGHHNGAVLRELAHGALLHDIGEAQVEDKLLNKSDALNTKEWDTIKKHPQVGYDILEPTQSLGEIALDVVLHHHERLTGSGYPHKLQGQSISPFVRIVSIADIFDALTTDRPHRKKHTTFDAIGLMHQSMKDDLDPDLLRLFVEMMGGTAAQTTPKKPLRKPGQRLFQR